MTELARAGIAAIVLLAAGAVAARAAEVPDAIAAKGETLLVELHAEGAQI